MIVVREIRKRAKWLVGPLVGLALSAYFGYHLIEGDRGLRAWVRAAQELRVSQETLASVSARRGELEHRVSHMRPDHVDPDLLDTQVRKTLDLVSPNELVILQETTTAAPPAAVSPAPPAPTAEARPRQ